MCKSMYLFVHFVQQVQKLTPQIFVIYVAIGRLYIYKVLRIVLLSWGLCIVRGTGRDQWFAVA